MQFLKVLPAIALLAAVAGCTYPATDTERAVVGAVAGGVIADATDNNVLAGAAIGGAGGAFCDNLGLC